jgi:hypothetical protein
VIPNAQFRWRIHGLMAPGTFVGSKRTIECHHHEESDDANQVKSANAKQRVPRFLREPVHGGNLLRNARVEA